MTEPSKTTILWRIALVAAIAVGFVWSLRRGTSITRAVRAWFPIAAAGVVLLVLFLPVFTSLYGVTVQRFLLTEPPAGGNGSAGAGLGGGGSSGTFTPARVALYVGSLKIARDDFPLGAGLGRYGSWMSRVDYSPLYKKYGLSRIPGLRERNPKAATDTFWQSPHTWTIISLSPPAANPGRIQIPPRARSQPPAGQKI